VTPEQIVYSVLARIPHHPNDHEDLEQEAWMELWRIRNSHDPKRINRHRYLWSRAYCACVDALRRWYGKTGTHRSKTRTFTDARLSRVGMRITREEFEEGV